LQREVRVAVESAAANADELPAQPFENGLSCHVVGELFERVVTVAIALDRQTPAGALDHHVDPVVADPPLRGDPVTGVGQAPEHLALER
jgi:hypothetical protein